MTVEIKITAETAAEAIAQVRMFSREVVGDNEAPEGAVVVPQTAPEPVVSSTAPAAFSPSLVVDNAAPTPAKPRGRPRKTPTESPPAPVTTVPPPSPVADGAGTQLIPPAVPATPAATVSSAEMRAKLTELMNLGGEQKGLSAVTAIVHGMGFKLVKEIPEDKFAEVYAKAEAEIKTLSS